MGTLLVFVLFIGPLILVHELGHLLAAKLAGVKVVRFSIGFGPTLVSFHLGGTEWRLALLPLGGHAKLLGKRLDEPVPPLDAERAFSARPPWARLFVLGAGPVANLGFPLFLYLLYFLALVPSDVPPAVLGTVVEDSAADHAGLRQGDRIVSIDGHTVHSWGDMSQRVAEAPDHELRLQVERDGELLDLAATPQMEMKRNALGESQPEGRLGTIRRFYAPQIGIVGERSPAYAAGLRTGDVITSINGERLRTIEELQPMLEATGGGLVRLTYLRAEPVPGPLGTYLFYESAQVRMLPHEGEDGRPSTGILPANTFIRVVDSNSPAERAGLQPGDRILEIDGRPITQWESLDKVLYQRQQQPVDLLVQSPGERQPRTVVMRQEIRTWRDIYRQDRESLWFGARPYEKWTLAPNEPIRGRLTYAMTSALEETGSVFSMLGTSFSWGATQPYGGMTLAFVFRMASSAVEQGLSDVLIIMTWISIIIGFVNLLPIPGLDGTHLLFLLIEVIIRRPLEQRVRDAVNIVLCVVLLVGWMMLP